MNCKLQLINYKKLLCYKIWSLRWYEGYKVDWSGITGYMWWSLFCNCKSQFCCHLLRCSCSVCRAVKTVDYVKSAEFSRQCHHNQYMCNNNNNNNMVDFFIWRFTRDLISVPVPLNAHTTLQLCSDYGFLLLLWRRPGPVATRDICF